jgi:hypothetical protein
VVVHQGFALQRDEQRNTRDPAEDARIGSVAAEALNVQNVWTEILRSLAQLTERAEHCGRKSREGTGGRRWHIEDETPHPDSFECLGAQERVSAATTGPDLDDVTKQPEVVSQTRCEQFHSANGR